MGIVEVAQVNNQLNINTKGKTMEAKLELEKSIFELLQEVRNVLSNTEIKKSGYNAFAKFNYFELKDFLSISTKLFNERGICPVFNIELDSNGIEYARLDLIKGMELITFRTPTAEPSGNNPIQNLGAKITYLRRYLYLMALDLVENDVVDAQEPVKEDPVVYATPLQVEEILNNKDLIMDLLKERGIKSKNDIKKLTLDEADEIINAIEKLNG